MYQENIAGKNAIDLAFNKNSIFCISAFVESLLKMNETSQFNNCFDKAFLMMLRKGMDMKDLLQSSLIYPILWQNETIYHDSPELNIVAYNNDLEEL